MVAPSDLDSKYGRKNDQNLTNCFFQKKKDKSSSETKFHENRQYTVEPIFANICDMAPRPLPLGVGTTIVNKNVGRILEELYKLRSEVDTDF